MTAAELCESYDGRFMPGRIGAADAKYLGQVLEVTGEVKDMTERKTVGDMTEVITITHVTLKSGNGSKEVVRCEFVDVAGSVRDRLLKGAQVTIRGRCTGELGGHVGLEKCILK